MKKNYLIILAIIFIVLSSLLLKINFLKLPIDLIRKIINPITENFYSKSSLISEKINNVININNIINENKKLKEENEELYKKNNYLIQKSEELEVINKSIGYLSDFNYKMAKVLTIDKELTNTLIINVGKKDGIEIGYPVIFEDGFLIGKIINVDENTSTVLLTIDKNSEVAATISGLNRNLGIINGSYGLNFSFNYVSIKEDIKEGDVIVTSGIEKNIPSGFLIGKVSKISYLDSDFFKTISVSPLVSFENFRVVSVIIPK